jgi:hypothetical protein
VEKYQKGNISSYVIENSYLISNHLQLFKMKIINFYQVPILSGMEKNIGVFTL